MTHSDRNAPGRTRRAVLAGTGALAATALAGCLGDSQPSGGGGAAPTGTTDDGPLTLETHPAAAGLEDQPRLGPDPREAEAVVVAFSDPSCPRCRAFERNTVPRIETELVEPGRATYVFRGYPVVYPWGKLAAQALESTDARDADAFWALVRYYFDEQPAFDESNVLDRTRTFLAETTDLDAAAVVADAEASAHDDAVQVDLDAGMDAGAGRTTPHVFLFKDGKYRTKAAGSVSFSVVANALGV